MFTKTSKESEKMAAVLKVDAPPSLLSATLSVTGNLLSDGELQIDGNVIGDIQAENLIVGETANISGEIRATSVRIHGKVTGQISGKSVSLSKTAHVQGDILHENLAIEQGAYLEGHCRRVEGSQKKSADNPISLLVKGGSKTKLETPSNKPQVGANI